MALEQASPIGNYNIDWPEIQFGSFEVRAAGISTRFSVTSISLQIDQITNQANGICHLEQPSGILSLAASALDSETFDDRWGVDTVDQPSPAGGMRVSGRMPASHMTFVVTISPVENRPEIEIRLLLQNTGSLPLHVRAIFPSIDTLATHYNGEALQATVPQEAGGVASFREDVSLGMGVDPDIGLPTAMNMMELVSIHDPAHGGGVYFLDGESDLRRDLAPIQFTLKNSVVAGHWVTDLPPHSEQMLPALVIGVHAGGDWHVAVDQYNKRRATRPAAATIPAWLRDQGAIYSFSGFGGGSIYMAYPHASLDTRIPSFYELPRLLEEAKSLGTNILYLWDYWEGASEGNRPAYWNKGDYKPREDLGGASALNEGIRKIHEQDGRVIFYLEWFIAYWYSEVGKSYGEEWAARRRNGDPHDHYVHNYSLPASGEWRDHLIAVAVRLVREFGIDGIYLDSMGWQMNWPATTRSENKRYTAKEFTQEALRLVERLRSAIREVKPDAVVIGENTGGLLPDYWDGGLSADFVWLASQNQHKLLASPVRYGVPSANIYSNGHDRDEMHQIFAAGHNLALANAHLPDAAYISRLVRVRQDYKDALIYGAQTYQPRTGDGNVVAYFYQGARHAVITVVNISDEPYQGELSLQPETPTDGWRTVWGDGDVVAAPEGLRAQVPPKELLVLARTK